MNLHDKLYDVENPREFWTQIGIICIFNERKSSIPFEVLMDDNKVSTNYDTIMRKWKSDYEILYNNDNNNSNETDNQHLQYVKNSIRDSDNAVFPKPDCTSLNNPITYEEVHKSGVSSEVAKSFRHRQYSC